MSDTARHSVAVIDRLYTQFEEAGDRAGQHHALSMALVIFDRARWTGKVCEADIFRQWLVAHLEPEHTTDTAPTTVTAVLVLEPEKADEESPTLSN